jgi:hypothetical protein
VETYLLEQSERTSSLSLHIPDRIPTFRMDTPTRAQLQVKASNKRVDETSQGFPSWGKLVHEAKNETDISDEASSITYSNIDSGTDMKSISATDADILQRQLRGKTAFDQDEYTQHNSEQSALLHGNTQRATKVIDTKKASKPKKKGESRGNSKESTLSYRKQGQNEALDTLSDFLETASNSAESISVDAGYSMSYRISSKLQPKNPANTNTLTCSKKPCPSYCTRISPDKNDLRIIYCKIVYYCNAFPPRFNSISRNNSLLT